MQGYSEGSMWKAVMVEDVCFLGSLKGDVSANEELMKNFGIPFQIGCQVKETGSVEYFY